MISGIDILQEVLRECLEEKETKMAGQKNAQPMTRETENGLEKWCSKCEKYHPADEDHFYTDKRSKTKLSSWCRKCQRASVGSSNKKENPVKGDGNNTLVLDFSKHQDLWDGINMAAQSELRTPVMQIFWWLYQREEFETK